MSELLDYSVDDDERKEEEMNANNSTVAPLRKIVDRPMVSIGNDGETEYFMRKELLECGHIVSPKQDIYGPTNAARRRCPQCHKEND